MEKFIHLLLDGTSLRGLLLSIVGASKAKVDNLIISNADNSSGTSYTGDGTIAGLALNATTIVLTGRAVSVTGYYA